MTHRNLFACLVHERPETVADLVRNLRCLDPESEVLLYNGGGDRALLRRRFTANGREPLIHPAPQRQTWGRLHGFALDCMRFGLEETDFDTLTIVDSDQLLLRRGYSEQIAAFLTAHPRAGVLASATGRQPRTSTNPPVVSAWREHDRWRALCRRLGDSGDEIYPQWTFWPTTVFTAAACRDLVRLFEEDAELARVMRASKIFATEEIVLPTLAALLGHEVVESPCRHDFVKYRVDFTPAQLRAALRHPDVFFAHPIPRPYDDPLRALIRDHHHGYASPILERMRPIEGWLSDDEAEVLIAGVRSAREGAIVELGSFCGRATTVLASVVQEQRPGATVHAIDPHDGVIGARDREIVQAGPTLSRFRRNIASAGVADSVTTIRSRPCDVAWTTPIAFLLIDGLHDYASVAADFRHFERSLTEDACVAFHDYADYFPGVQRFADELTASGRYVRTALAGSMLVLRRVAARSPTVSCVMPTYDRPAVIARAVAGFLRQDYTDAELIVVDDGPQPINKLLPDHPRVRYLRLDDRHTIGTKRNIGFAAARGDLLANWDDDDWYAPWRLSREVETITTTGADVVGLDRLLYLDPATGEAWRYAWPANARAWAHDAVLLFTRRFWTRNPFPDTSVSIDTRFLWTAGRKKIVTIDDDFYVGLIHHDNTSPKNTGQALWTPHPVDELAALMGDDAARFGCPPALVSAGGSPRR